MRYYGILLYIKQKHKKACLIIGYDNKYQGI